MPAPSIDDVVESLRCLRAGHRAWFRFCPSLAEPHPPLLITPLRTDARMKRLKELAAAQPVPLGATLCMGIASMDAGGKLQLGSPALRPSMLATLAAWVRRNVTTHPDLARLKGTTFVTVSPAGRIVERHADPALWQDIPSPTIPGTIAETASRLSSLRPGRSAWFWMTDSGPDRQPFLSLGSARRDPSGEAFAQRIRDLRRRIPSPGTATRGVLQVLEDGTVALTTRDSIDDALPILHTLHQTHGALLPRLRTARLVQIVGEELVRAARLEVAGPVADLSRQAELLASLGEESRVLFWFTDAGSDGQPVLLLETDPAALRAAAKPLRGTGASIRGRVVLTRRGWLEFRLKNAYAGLIPALAKWAAIHAGDWPALTRLRSARATQRDQDGAIVARERDDAAWDALPPQ